jgi:hypothetical protein
MSVLRPVWQGLPIEMIVANTDVNGYRLMHPAVTGITGRRMNVWHFMAQFYEQNRSLKNL